MAPQGEAAEAPDPDPRSAEGAFEGRRMGYTAHRPQSATPGPHPAAQVTTTTTLGLAVAAAQAVRAGRRARRKSVEVEAAMARYEQSRARTLDGDANVDLAVAKYREAEEARLAESARKRLAVHEAPASPAVLDAFARVVQEEEHRR